MVDGTNRVTVVTGANRGLGFEACRQLAKQGYKVALNSRDAEHGRAVEGWSVRDKNVAPTAM